MADYTTRKIDDMEGAFGGFFRKAGAELEVSSFGMNIIDMPPNAGEQYPDHDHTHDGQEEVYIVLRGSGRIVVDGNDIPLDADTITRVGASLKRKISAGPDGMRLLALGGNPGAVYHRPEVFGLSDPAAG